MKSKPAKIVLVALMAVFLIGFVLFSYEYIKYAKIVDARMRGQIFSTAAKIYAAPAVINLQDPADLRDVANRLRRAGYTEQDQGGDSNIGTFSLHSHFISITPGPGSFHRAENATLYSENGTVIRITVGGNDVNTYELEPELITALFEGEQRSKRRLVQYDDIPKVMVDAVLAIEDRRFFQHSGVNYFRLAEAAWIDLTRQTHEQGASTLTMQIARGFFLTPEKTVRRKLTEMLIAVELEQRFSKKEIFELYANQVYMGQRGSFTITGFGEAAQSYFGKDLKNLTLPEAALLAGIIQRPNYLSPYKNPERALERRNLVLETMVDSEAITHEEAERAKAATLHLAPPNVEASNAPFFVDLIKDTLAGRYSERELNEQAYRIYTTLDMNLQRAAAEAVEIGMKEVDAQVRKQRTKKVPIGKTGRFETKLLPGPPAQVALIAMNPHTGEVLALVGGRNYGISQLDHAVAKRPTGSVFKPFVYAAAVNTGVTGAENIITPASLVDDSPTTFTFGDQIYEPRNYQEKYLGQVSLRYALALSLNNATVRVAEATGYDKVAELARNAGIRSVKATPAMALGAYEATPLDMAGAYTVFANYGTHINPMMVRSLRNARGGVVENFTTEKRQVLDPRVAYVMTNMLEGVLNFGTAAGVRSRGFTAPAAGKTGTSHDAWFAGYTNNLMCIVWVGYDDYSDLHLSGAYTAAPIWAEFMKRALKQPAYRDPKGFGPPAGVDVVMMDKVTNKRATPSCPDIYYAAFIAGTEPKETCDNSSAAVSVVLPQDEPSAEHSPPVLVSNSGQQPPVATGQPAEPAKKKRGFWSRLFGGGDDKKDEKKDEKKQDVKKPDVNKKDEEKKKAPEGTPATGPTKP